jgi:hypothetical protein
LPRTLEFWPQQQHHLLVAGDRTIKAGGTFEASDEDAEELLANPEIRVPPVAPTPTVVPRGTMEQRSDKDAPHQSTQPQSPGRAERSTITDRRP